jgi:hypothetical protein
MAGSWVYADPLNLYEAFREQVTVTALDDVVEANFTHNYNNGSYQNSVIHVTLGNNQVASVTVNNEARAERMVVYLNYLAWARGPEGGDRANLAPSVLGGLAKYVSRNDHEPLDSENNINLSLIELDIDEVPEQPAREGRAIPSFLPYVLLLVVGVVCFFGMRALDTRIRDDAIYNAVMKETIPPTIEPRYLRAYLADPWTSRHREKVTEKLSTFYDEPIKHVKTNARHPALGQGMAEVLESLRRADQPVISVQVTERESPQGKEGAKARQEKLRTEFADGVNTAFERIPNGGPVRAPEGKQFKDPPPPIGHQLVAFVAKPDDAPAAHFDISYSFEPLAGGQYRIAVMVEVRTDIEKPPVASGSFTLPGPFGDADADTAAITKVREALIDMLIGPPAPAGGAPQPPGPAPGF